jgi:copper chaperone CopZ
LVCSFCAEGIDKTFRKNPATADVIVSLAEKLVVVATKPGSDISDAELTKAMTDAGYEVKAIARTQRTMAEIRQLVRQASQ